MRIFFKILPYALTAIFSAAFVYLLYDKFNHTEEKVTVVTHDIILEKIVPLAKVELVKYQFKDFVEYSEPIKLFGFINKEAELNLVVTGEVVGCIDLAKVTADHIQYAGDSVYVKLPPPEICYHKIANEKTRIISGTYTEIVGADHMLKQALINADTTLLNTAIEGGILIQTRNNAELMLRPLLENVSGKRVFFVDELPNKLPDEKIILRD